MSQMNNSVTRSFAPPERYEHSLIIEPSSDASGSINVEGLISHIKNASTVKLPSFKLFVIDEDNRKVSFIDHSKRTKISLDRKEPARERYTPTLEAVGETFGTCAIEYRDLTPELTEARANEYRDSRSFISSESLFVNYVVPALMVKFSPERIAVHHARLNEIEDSYKDFIEASKKPRATPSPSPSPVVSESPVPSKSARQEASPTYDVYECLVTSYDGEAFDLIANNGLQLFISSLIVEKFFNDFRGIESIANEWENLRNELSQIHQKNKQMEQKVKMLQDRLQKSSQARREEVERELNAALGNQRRWLPINTANQNRIRPVCSALREMKDNIQEWADFRNDIFRNAVEYKFIITAKKGSNPDFQVKAILPKFVEISTTPVNGVPTPNSDRVTPLLLESPSPVAVVKDAPFASVPAPRRRPVRQ